MLLLVKLGLEGRDLINDTDSAWAVYASRNALLPYLLVIFLELVQVFKLTFEFSCYQKMLCLLVDSEHVIVLIMELLKFDLVETERRQPAEVRACGHQRMTIRREEALLRNCFGTGKLAC